MLTQEESKRLRNIIEIETGLSDDEIEKACSGTVLLELVRIGIQIDMIKETVANELRPFINRISDILKGIQK